MRDTRPRFAPEYVTYVLNENFEDAKARFLAPLMEIHDAHLVMLASTHIVSAADAHALRAALDDVSQDEVRRTLGKQPPEQLDVRLDTHTVPRQPRHEALARYPAVV